ncbi:flavodoxin domain-containing protein [Nocardia thailandica]|uniref:Flavodoxin domain-containing protein n=1 Tax=Nocardia thailandica TaxID=257275 RepID=A0ABW6PV16_9NOCA
MLFASITCNTEEIADLLATGLGEAGVTTEVKQIFAVDAAELSGYDIVALGSYTWMEGELADECLALYHALDTVDLSGKLGLAFGSCDAAYSPYGAAVDLLDDKLRSRGALVAEPLKVPVWPGPDAKERCVQAGRALGGRRAA